MLKVYTCKMLHDNIKIFLRILHGIYYAINLMDQTILPKLMEIQPCSIVLTVVISKIYIIITNLLQMATAQIYHTFYGLKAGFLL
jgi:hypothetical protein